MNTIFLLAIICVPAFPQHATTAITNPFDTPADRSQGEVTYRSQCASCHGIDGKGSAGVANLASGVFKHGASDEGIYKSISQGVPGTSMPGFKLNGREVWQVVAYVRSLNRDSAAGAGDASRGEQLVASSGCLKCHSIGTKGAALGPDLAQAASTLSPAELRQALLTPDARVSPEYWRWTGRLTDGSTLTGSRLNEDTFSIQLMDAKGRLVTIDKARLKDQSLEKKSPMPSFDGKLTPAQQFDIVAYLVALKGKRQ